MVNLHNDNILRLRPRLPYIYVCGLSVSSGLRIHPEAAQLLHYCGEITGSSCVVLCFYISSTVYSIQVCSFFQRSGVVCAVIVCVRSDERAKRHTVRCRVLKVVAERRPKHIRETRVSDLSMREREEIGWLIVLGWVILLSCGTCDF